MNQRPLGYEHNDVMSAVRRMSDEKTYKLELEVALDEADEQKIIAAARDHYHATGHAQAPVGADGQTWRNISAEEAIPDAVEAIMELIGGDATLEEAGIEVVSILVTSQNPEIRFRSATKTALRHKYLGPWKQKVRMHRAWMNLKPECTSVDGPTESSRSLGQKPGGKHLFNSTSGPERIRPTWFPWTSAWWIFG